LGFTPRKERSRIERCQQKQSCSHDKKRTYIGYVMPNRLQVLKDFFLVSKRNSQVYMKYTREKHQENQEREKIVQKYAKLETRRREVVPQGVTQSVEDHVS